MKTIKTYGNLAEAGFACSLLEAAGVRAALLDEQSFLLTPGMLTAGIRLQVEEADMERALALLATGPTSRLPADSVPTEPPAVAQTSKSSALGPVFIAAALAGVIGFLIGIQWTEWRPFTADRVQKVEYDYDRDGRPDHTVTYRDDRLESGIVDRNRDGKTDGWDAFDAAGRPAESRLDDNFDGQPDAWFEYRDGSLWAERRDVDFDGRVDWIWNYEHDLRTQGEVVPDADGRVRRKEVYRHGVLSEEWVDENRDGAFDSKIAIDPFGNRSERLPLR